MRLGTAIECLVDNYKYASDKEWINDKVAWALYHTWKEADRKTEPTGYNLSPVDKDINVRSKIEPQTDKWSHDCIGCANNNTCEFAFTDAVKICKYVKTEPQTDCPWK